MAGKLIVFEGIEGCGKTTQIQQIQPWLVDRLSLNHSPGGKLHQPGVQVTREPGGTQLGQHLRDLLLHHEIKEPLSDRSELLLYAADRAQHIETLIKPLLDRGTMILCDRFTDSTLAYQGYGRGLDLQQIHQINQIATGGLVPDLTLWLNVPVEAGLTRIKARKKVDRIEQADLEFHYRVAEGFATLAKMYPQRIVPIDGNGDRDHVTQQIKNILNQKLLEWGLISNNDGCL